MTNFHPGTVSTLVLQGIREWWQRIQPRNKIDSTINGNLDILHHYGLYVCCHHNVEANGKCLYFCLFEFLSKTMYTEELIWRRWGVGGLLSVSAGGVPVLFRKVHFQKRKCVFRKVRFPSHLLSLCLSSWGWGELCPHVTAGERDTDSVQSRFLPFEWKENDLRLPTGRAGSRRGCVTAAALKNFVESLQMQGSSVGYCRVSHTPHMGTLCCCLRTLMLASSKFS